MSGLDWTWLANEIRKADGNHDLGAGELAGRLVEVLEPVIREARAAAVAPLEKALDRTGRLLDLWLTGDEDFNEASVRAEIRTIRALLSAPSPVREPDK